MTMRVLLLLSLGFLAACEPVKIAPESVPAAGITARKTPTTTVAVYQCGPDLRLVVEFREQSAWVFLPERSLPLAQVVAASGARYQGDGVSLWSKGERAMLELDGVEQPECKADRRQATWERAKLAGAEFRALGQEPAWVLELYPKRLLLQLDYGQTRIETSAVAVKEDATTGVRRYEIETEVHHLVIELRDQLCRDTMSDEQFPVSVQLSVNGRSLNGCGRSLR